MDLFNQAWMWLGHEIAEFGLRWLVVVSIMLGFGGWFGRRYRETSRRLADLETKAVGDKGRTVSIENLTISKPTTQVSQPEPVRTAQKMHVRDEGK